MHLYEEESIGLVSLILQNLREIKVIQTKPLLKVSLFLHKDIIHLFFLSCFLRFLMCVKIIPLKIKIKYLVLHVMKIGC